MEDRKVERRLVAVLAADIAGYTRLMEADEEATFPAWRSARAEVIDPAIGEHGGRIVKHTGDGFIAEFPTVQAAVRCSAAMQADFAARNADVPEDRRLAFRMGVNLGDIIADGEDIHGDGVNIAARLEGLAEAGGICVSASVHEQVHKRLDLTFEDLGKKSLKNIAKPIRVYFEAFVRDLEAVVDAAGLDRFPLLGLSQGASVSIAYAVRHRERVSKLVLYGGYAKGRSKRGSAVLKEEADAILTLMRDCWGRDNPAFRQMFTSMFIPGGSAEQMQWFNDLQRITTSSANAVRLLATMNEIDVAHLLPEVQIPTLVLHCRDDATVPCEEGRRMAAAIPGAQFVTLEGANHLILEHDPGWPKFRETARAFLAE